MSDCVSNPRMRFCCPGCSVTPTCWPLAWFSAPAASYGSSRRSWPMVSHFHTSVTLCLVIPLTMLITCSPFLFPHLLPAGSADTLLRTYFPDGMSESLIAYLLYGVLKALEYLHRMGYVHRSVGEMRRYRIQRNIYILHTYKYLDLNVCPHICLLSGGWRPVISCCQGRGVSTSQGSTVFTVWCVRGRGWGQCSTCPTTAQPCCPGSAPSYSGRSGLNRLRQIVSYN